MPISVYCTGCRSFTRLNIIERKEVEPGLDIHHFKCELCGYTWWEVDDYRCELEEDVLSNVQTQGGEN